MVPIFSCEYDPPTGTLLSYSGCKSEELISASTDSKVTNSEEITYEQECVHYEYDGKTLYFTHVNGLFNCCPGTISADIAIVDNTITIIEDSSDSECWCYCLFDIDYMVQNLERDIYTIKIGDSDNMKLLIECGEDMEFEIDLTTSHNGSYCASRDGNIWYN
jgi:hypothetical protein